MDRSQPAGMSSTGANRKRRSSILKSQRAPRTPFSELEFNVATPTDATKSRRVSFSRKTGVAEFITNEATTTWKNFYEEKNKSIESSGHDSDIAPRPSVGHIGSRIFDQQFQDETEIDFVTLGSSKPLDINVSNNENITQQIALLDATVEKVTAPQNEFELSAFTETTNAKFLKDNLTNPVMGEASGRIDINFSALNTVGSMNDKDDLDEIEQDFEMSRPNVVGPAPFDGDLSQYIEVDFNVTHGDVKNTNESDMSITDTIHSPKKELSTIAQNQPKKDWSEDKENIVVNPYVTPAESENFAINEAPEQILVFTGKKLKYVDINADLDEIVEVENKNEIKIAAVQKENIDQNITGDMSMTKALPATIQQEKRQTIVFENDGDISMTQCVPVLPIVGIKPRFSVKDIDAGTTFIDDLINDIENPTNIDESSTSSRKTIYDDNVDVSEYISNLKSVLDKSIAQKIESSNMMQNLPSNKRETIVFDNYSIDVSECGNNYKSILDNEEPKSDYADMSVTQALPNRVITIATLELNNKSASLPNNLNRKPEKIPSIDSKDTVSSVTISMASATTSITPKESEFRTYIDQNTSINMSITRPISSVIKADSQNDTHDLDMSMTKVIPAVVQIDNTTPESEEKNNMSMTKVIPSVIGLASQCQQLEEEEIGVSMSITNVLSSKMNLSSTTQQTDAYLDTDMSITKAVSRDIDIDDQYPQAQDDESFNMSITKAIPSVIKIDSQNKENAEDLSSNMSITKAVPSVIKIGSENEQNDETNINKSITKAVPSVMKLEIQNQVSDENMSVAISKSSVLTVDDQNQDHYKDTSTDMLSTKTVPSIVTIDKENNKSEVNENITTTRSLPSFIKIGSEKQGNVDQVVDRLTADVPLTRSVVDLPKSEPKSVEDMEINYQESKTSNNVETNELDEEQENKSVTRVSPTNLSGRKSIHDIHTSSCPNKMDITMPKFASVPTLPVMTIQNVDNKMNELQKLENTSNDTFFNKFMNIEEVISSTKYDEDGDSDMLANEDDISKEQIETAEIKEEKMKSNKQEKADADTPQKSMSPDEDSLANVSASLCVSNIRSILDKSTAPHNLEREQSRTIALAVTNKSVLDTRALSNKDQAKKARDSSTAPNEQKLEARISTTDVVTMNKDSENPVLETKNSILSDLLNMSGASLIRGFDEKGVQLDLVQGVEKSEQEIQVPVEDVPSLDVKKSDSLFLILREDEFKTISTTPSQVMSYSKDVQTDKMPEKSILAIRNKVKKLNSDETVDEEIACDSCTTVSREQSSSSTKSVNEKRSPKRKSLKFSDRVTKVEPPEENPINIFSEDEDSANDSLDLKDENLDVELVERSIKMARNKMGKDIIKKLCFENDEIDENSTLLKKTAFGETSYMKDGKSKVIPGLLKDVCDDVLDLMKDLVKPMRDAPFPAVQNKHLQEYPSVTSNEVQASLVSSSQIDLDYDLMSNPSTQDVRRSLASDIHKQGVESVGRALNKSVRPVSLPPSSTGSDLNIKPLNNVDDYIDMPDYVKPRKKDHPLDLPYDEPDPDRLKFKSEVIPEFNNDASQSYVMTNDQYDMKPPYKGPQQRATVVFDPSNPLNNILMSPLGFSSAPGYAPSVRHVSINENSEEEEDKVSHSVYHIKQAPTCVSFSTQPPSTANFSLKSFMNSDDSSGSIQTSDKVERVTELKDAGANTVIAMKTNKELLSAVSSVMLYYDNDIESNSRKRNFSDLKQTEVNVTPKNLAQSDINLESPSKVVQTSQSTTPKQAAKIQKLSDSPINNSKDSFSKGVKSPPQKSPLKPRSPLTKETLISTTENFLPNKAITVQRIQTEYAKIKSEIANLGSKTHKSSQKTDQVKPNQLVKELELVSSLANTVKPDIDASYVSMESHILDTTSSKKRWAADCISQESSKQLMKEVESAVNVMAMINMMPFMGSTLCEWGQCALDTLSWRLLHGKIRLSAKLEHRHENGVRKHVAADTPVISVFLKAMAADSTNAIVSLCVRYAVEAMRCECSRRVATAGDLPQLLRKCAAIAKVAARWARAMRMAWLRLAYDVTSDGTVTFKVANIPLRAAWQISLRISMSVSAPHEVPWPRAHEVLVMGILADNVITDEEVARVLSDVPKDWGHVPHTLWKLFRHLKNMKTTADPYRMQKLY